MKAVILQITNNLQLSEACSRSNDMMSIKGFIQSMVVEQPNGTHTIQALFDVDPHENILRGQRCVWINEKRILSGADVYKLKSLTRELLSGADKCSREPLNIVQPFMGIVLKYTKLINKLKLLYSGAGPTSG